MLDGISLREGLSTPFVAAEADGEIPVEVGDRSNSQCKRDGQVDARGPEP